MPELEEFEAAKPTVDQFAAKIKLKYPQYSDMDDLELTKSIIDKHPQYLRKIDQQDYLKRSVAVERQRMFGEQPGYERFLAGAGKGMMDIYEGGKQILPFIEPDPEYAEESRIYEGMAEGDPYSLAGEITGATALTLPIGGLAGAAGKTLAAAPKLARGAQALAKAPKVLKAFGAAGAGGAGMGAIEFTEDDESTMQNALYGGLFGVAGQGAAKLTQKIGTKAFNALKGKMKNASATELIELSRKHDVPLSFGDVSGEAIPKKLEVIAEDVPFVGTGAFRQKGLEKTQKAIEKTRDKFKTKMIETGEDIGRDYDVVLEESAKTHSKKVKKKAKELYDKLNEVTKGTTLEVGSTKKSLNWAEKQLDESLTKNTDIESFVKQVKDKLTQKTTGTPDIPAGPSKFKKTGRKDVVTGKDIMDEIPGKAAIPGKPAKGVKFEDLRQLRSDLGNKIDDWSITNKKAAGMASKLKQAVEEDLEKLAGSPYGEVKKAWKEADDFYKNKVVPVNAKELAKALKKGEADQIYSTFIKAGKGDKAQKFFNALDEKGQSAVRSGMIEEAIEKATTPKGIISPAKFAGYLERMKDAKDVFFKGRDKQELDGFSKLMRAAERFGEYGSNPPTGQRMIAQGLIDPYQFAKSMMATPVLKAFFTTKKGRNFLLASNKLDLGSDKMNQLFGKISQYIESGAAKISAQTAIQSE